MPRFDILTLFPRIIDSYSTESIIGRACEQKKISVISHDIRSFALDKHHVVDDRPYGGGPGMVLKADVLAQCLLRVLQVPRTVKTIVQFRQWKKKKKIHVVALSAGGTFFTQVHARRIANKYQRVVLVCGRYEGIDNRFMKLVDRELSIGPYVVTGGELPALVITDAVARLLSGVLGKDESSIEESHSREGYIEYPHYTRPEAVELFGKNYKVPRILMSGNHSHIERWRAEQSEKRTP